MILMLDLYGQVGHEVLVDYDPQKLVFNGREWTQPEIGMWVQVNITASRTVRPGERDYLVNANPMPVGYKTKSKLFVRVVSILDGQAPTDDTGTTVQTVQDPRGGGECSCILCQRNEIETQIYS